MGLVDHIDLVLALRRRKADLVPELPHLIDAAVRGRVDLDQVEKTSLADGDAVLAAIARLAILGVRAVHGLRDEARDGRLSRATNACQQVSVRDLPARDRVPPGPRDVLLSDDRAERLGTVAAVESGALRHRSRIDAGGFEGGSPHRLWPCTLRRWRPLGHAHASWLRPGLPAARSD